MFCAAIALTAAPATLRRVGLPGDPDDTHSRYIEAEVDGLILRHEAEPAETRPELSGHFHPKLRITRRGRQVSRRCFVATATKLILPAFGSLTGGLDAHHPEILRAVGAGAQALVPVQDRLLRFPIAA